jgi:hypothetical protein
LLLIGVAAWSLAMSETAPAVCEALARGRVTKLYVTSPVRVSCPGLDAVDVVGTPIASALGENDATAVTRALTQEKGAAVGVRPGSGGKGVAAQLEALAHVSGMRALVLSSEVAVYAPFREPTLSSREGEALAYVARALMRGAREPNLASFPAALRKVERVEVIVTLSEHGEPRLWRSARGTSIARTMITATRVARDRWHEREQAMGGPLTKRLLSLDVEVGLLSEDGTLATTQRAFVDRAISAQHGLGFDYRSGWHYLAPSDVQKRGKGSAFTALTGLLSDQGLGLSALNDPNMRLYRFVPMLLGVSKAPLASDGASAD